MVDDTIVSRRGGIQLALAAAAGMFHASASSAAAAAVAPPAAGKRRAIRLAHLTDMHVYDKRASAAGLAACLRHVQALADPPELILNGGDSVMDVLAAPADRAAVQHDLFRKALKQDCSLPVEHCIGNHDVWGWNRKASRTAGDEPGWGKRWATDLFGLDRRYRSFDRAGWHFVVLDSTFPVVDPKGEPYTAKLDDEQFDWLARDLAAAPAGTPVCVLSHIPILSAAAFMDGENAKTGDWQVPGAWMHVDARRIGTLFTKHPNVKLCLSGHLHLFDRCQYNDVWYVCNGAVCGGWWKGDYHETPAGYGVVDLYADGTFDAQYVAYGWAAVKE